MNRKHLLSATLCSLAALLLIPASHPLHAQGSEAGGMASKLMVRGDLYGVQVQEMRAQKRSEVLVIQTELYNPDNRNRQMFWRYRWLDSSGMQVGDGDAWKPLTIYGHQSQLLKGVAPGMNVTDFRLEMNVEKP